MNKMIAWMAENHVTANLLMFLIVIGGIGSLLGLKQEVFPETSMDLVTVSIAYPGATPDEVERSVTIPVEDAVAGLNGVEEVTSSSSEGLSVVSIKAIKDYDVTILKDKIEAEIGRITSFPEETKDPIITEVEQTSPVVQVGIAGNISESELKKLAEEVKDELRSDKDITQVSVQGLREYEISIELSENALREYGLSFAQVMNAVKSGSLELPGGKIKTREGEILIRTSGLAKETGEFEEIVVKTLPNGDVVKLYQVGTVRNSFEDSDTRNYFNGKAAAVIVVKRTGDQNAIKVSDAVKRYIEKKQKKLPAGIELITWNDRSILLKQRLDLLMRNGRLGLLLVLLVLTLFLDIRLAFWASAGIGLSFLGAFWVMSLFDLSINMISLFAFIIVLGIVVDDAIVVGENVFSHREKGINPLKASKVGAQRIAVPVIFAVLTTVATFSPMLFVEGLMGKIMYQVPIVVIAVLLFSLLESLLILPAHLSSLKLHSTNFFIKQSQNLSRKADALLSAFVKSFYLPLLKWVIKWPSLVIGVAAAVFILTIGLMKSGKIKTEMMPKAEGDIITLQVTMPNGVSVAETEAVLRQCMANAEKIEKDSMSANPALYGTMFENTLISIGSSTNSAGPGASSSISSATFGEIILQFPSAEDRSYELESIMNDWRAMNNRIAGPKSVSYSNSLIPSGDAIAFNFSHDDPDSLYAAVQAVKEELRSYKGVKDIRDSYEEGKEELQISLKPLAHSIGITVSEIAMQVRQGFYGGEALRLQRGKDDIAVMVRYSEDERSSLEAIRNMQLKTRLGTSIQLRDVAEVVMGSGYSTITRDNQKRVITVSADVDESKKSGANANDIFAKVKVALTGKAVGKIPALPFFPEKWKEIRLGEEKTPLIKQFQVGHIRAQYPGLKVIISGMQKDQMKGMASLGKGFIVALFVVYILLAVPFKSYVQPFIVMSAIPFGIIGAVIGHFVMGYNISMISMMGIVALAGVVVNDSLVFVDFVNEERREGVNLNDAIMAAGELRFRPIFLTTVTTFVGLLPMIFEKSFQAKILIPMAISLGFGILFATLITLVLVPAFLKLLDWTQRKGAKLKDSVKREAVPDEIG